MVSLNIIEPAWQNYLRYLEDYFTSRTELATIEAMTRVLDREHNGCIFEHPSWAVGFKTEQDLAFFLLKWS